MRSVLKQPTAEVLSNRGVPVKVHIIEDGQRALGSDDKPTYTDALVRLDSYLLACLEDKYDGMEGLQKALEEKPNRTMVDVMAMIWETDSRTAGRMMVDGKQDDYGTALTVALLIANGVGGAEALKVLHQGVTMADDKHRQMSAVIDEILVEEGVKAGKKAGIPGQNGSGRGSRQVEVLTSSGS